MARYIDADELLRKSFRIEGHFDLPSGKAQNFSAINVTEIFNFPTADVAPVAHGYWIDNKHTDTVICSECKSCFSYETSYCPRCGAKMRGDNNE